MTQVKVATLADAERITVLINDAFRIAESFFTDEERLGPTEAQQLLQKGTFLIAEAEDVLAGCVYLEPRGDRIYLGLLAVDPAQQGNGVGSLLMDAAGEHARHSGAKYIDIVIVNLREELPEFYKRRGYVETGAAPFPADSPTKVPCFFINMSKAI